MSAARRSTAWLPKPLPQNKFQLSMNKNERDANLIGHDELFECSVLRFFEAAGKTIPPRNRSDRVGALRNEVARTFVPLMEGLLAQPLQDSEVASEIDDKSAAAIEQAIPEGYGGSQPAN